MSINPNQKPDFEPVKISRAYSRAEAIVVLARAVMLAAVGADSLAIAFDEGASDEEIKSADETNARMVRASFETAREFYRLAAETLEEAAKT